MNGTISQLHKGRGTNKLSDQQPVVLLNSVYQLLNYVINERLKKIVEPANILEPEQGGGRQGRCVGINMQKVHFIQQEARRQGKRVYQVDIDFQNSFNAMSQAALWQVMRMFKIPDVDLLAQGIVSRYMLFEWVMKQDVTNKKNQISGWYDEIEYLFETLCHLMASCDKWLRELAILVIIQKSSHKGCLEIF